METNKTFTNQMAWINVQSRSGAWPLEKYSVFGALSAASAYVNTIFSYEGQIIAVTENGKQTVYVLDSASDVSSTGLRRVGVLSASELCGINEYVMTSSINGKLALSALSDISSSFGNKVFITNPGTYLSDGMESDLSIEKVAMGDFEGKAISGILQDNTIYIVSSDYVECYGQQICNVTMSESENPDVNYLGIAATKPYVVEISGCLHKEIQQSAPKGVFYLSGQNTVSGPNTFLEGTVLCSDLCANSIYSNEHYSDMICCDFTRIQSVRGQFLSSVLDFLDNSPFVVEIAVREKEIIEFAELSDEVFSTFDPSSASVNKLAEVAQKIAEKVRSQQVVLPSTMMQMLEIVQEAIQKLRLGDKSQKLEFRLQHLRNVDAIVMNRLQSISADFEARIRALEQDTSVQALQARVQSLETIVSEMSGFINSNVFVTR